MFAIKYLIFIKQYDPEEAEHGTTLLKELSTIPSGLSAKQRKELKKSLRSYLIEEIDNSLQDEEYKSNSCEEAYKTLHECLTIVAKNVNNEFPYQSCHNLDSESNEITEVKKHVKSPKLITPDERMATSKSQKDKHSTLLTKSTSPKLSSKVKSINIPFANLEDDAVLGEQKKSWLNQIPQNIDFDSVIQRIYAKKPLDIVPSKPELISTPKSKKSTTLPGSSSKTPIKTLLGSTSNTPIKRLPDSTSKTPINTVVTKPASTPKTTKLLKKTIDQTPTTPVQSNQNMNGSSLGMENVWTSPGLQVAVPNLQPANMGIVKVKISSGNDQLNKINRNLVRHMIIGGYQQRNDKSINEHTAPWFVNEKPKSIFAQSNPSDSYSSTDYYLDMINKQKNKESKPQSTTSNALKPKHDAKSKVKKSTNKAKVDKSNDGSRATRSSSQQNSPYRTRSNNSSPGRNAIPARINKSLKRLQDYQSPL
ncbi:hypothetical protein BC833DRAFT_607140 [Globomyces pollinis-pini]|nr:hypothetical protein BC833DRAFT_607140 [Globomyces pollinis-pini]